MLGEFVGSCEAYGGYGLKGTVSSWAMIWKVRILF